MRVDILGTLLDTPSLAEAAVDVARRARARTPTTVLHRDAHGLLHARRDSAAKAAERAADMVLPDGMPLVWLARAAGAKQAERVYGPDLMEAVMAGPALRHALLGGAPGQAEALAAALARRFPHQVVAGILVPRVDTPPRPDPALAAALDALEADVCWVSLGTPKQDLWMAAHRPLLRTPVLIGCGAAFGFLGGTVRQAPRWMRRCGLEWAFRVGTEPRRLAGRYGRTVPLFALLAVGWLLRRGWAARASS